MSQKNGKKEFLITSNFKNLKSSRRDLLVQTADILKKGFGGEKKKDFLLDYIFKNKNFGSVKLQTDRDFQTKNKLMEKNPSTSKSKDFKSGMFSQESRKASAKNYNSALSSPMRIRNHILITESDDNREDLSTINNTQPKQTNSNSNTNNSNSQHEAKKGRSEKLTTSTSNFYNLAKKIKMAKNDRSCNPISITNVNNTHFLSDKKSDEMAKEKMGKIANLKNAKIKNVSYDFTTSRINQGLTQTPLTRRMISVSKMPHKFDNSQCQNTNLTQGEKVNYISNDNFNIYELNIDNFLNLGNNLKHSVNFNNESLHGKDICKGLPMAFQQTQSIEDLHFNSVCFYQFNKMVAMKLEIEPAKLQPSKVDKRSDFKNGKSKISTVSIMEYEVDL